MKRIARFAVLALVPFGLAPAAEHHASPHWAYDGAGGPDHWGDLDPSFQTCKLGHEQSPIDIPASTLKPAHLDPILFDYTTSPLHVVDNGHTVMATYGPGSAIHIGTATYELQQIHFHRPSEETIDGKSYPMVAHLVHRDRDGKLAVVAILFEEGAPNPTLATIFGAASKDQAPQGHDVDAKRLLPAATAYFTFPGSLTTPPCTEGVTWYVLRTPATASHDQIAAFAKHYAHNARPAQPLAGRTIRESE